MKIVAHNSRKTEFDRDVMTLDKACIVQTSMDRGQEVRGVAITCCPRATSGHAAAPPSSVINWRRLGSSMGSPPGRTRCASLPQAQDAPEAPPCPWGSPESF